MEFGKPEVMANIYGEPSGMKYVCECCGRVEIPSTRIGDHSGRTTCACTRLVREWDGSTDLLHYDGCTEDGIVTVTYQDGQRQTMDILELERITVVDYSRV